MAVFYVLPPRPLLGRHFAEYLRTIFPGLDWDLPTQINLTSALESAVTCHPEVYVLYREELPEDVSTFRGLIDGYGAERGDEVIEVRAGGRPGELVTHRFQITEAA